MKKRIFYVLVLLIALTSCDNKINTSSKKLTLKEYELELQGSYKKIKKARFGADTIDYQLLESENINFEKMIAECTSLYPNSISYSFDSLKKENIHIVSSSDKLLRIYSWNTWEGGTMAKFENLFHYQSNGKMYSKIIKSNDSNRTYTPFYSRIYTIEHNNRTYYLCVYEGVHSTQDASQSIKIIELENDKIKEVPLFKSGKNLISAIELNYNYFSVEDTIRPLELIKYNEKKKEILIPVLDKKGDVTKNYLTYLFNNTYFELIE